MSVLCGIVGGASGHARLPFSGGVTPANWFAAMEARSNTGSPVGSPVPPAGTWHWVQLEYWAWLIFEATLSLIANPGPWQARHTAEESCAMGCGTTGGAPSKARRAARSVKARARSDFGDVGKRSYDWLRGGARFATWFCQRAFGSVLAASLVWRSKATATGTEFVGRMALRSDSGSHERDGPGHADLRTGLAQAHEVAADRRGEQDGTEEPGLPF